jgi:tetratricopeptide (TPR) repeat protein
MAILKRLIIRWWSARIWLRFIITGAVLLLLQITPLPVRLIEAVHHSQSALAARDYPTAARMLGTAALYQPWNEQILSSEAGAEALANNLESARRDLERLAEVRSLTLQERIWLASVYAGQGETGRAITLWEQAGRAGDVNLALLADLASAHVDRQEFAQAVAAYGGLTLLEPDNPRTFYRLGVIQALEEPDKAALMLAQVEALDKSLAQKAVPLRDYLAERSHLSPDLAYTRLGVLYLALGEVSLADAALVKAYEINPAYGEALAYLAYARARLGKPALGPARQAVALDPQNPIVHYLAGLTWKHLNRLDDAQGEFEYAHDLDPNNPAYVVEIAEIQSLTGSPQWAEYWYQKAILMSPDELRFSILLAQFYVDENYHVEEAGLPLAKSLTSSSPDNAEVRDVLGWAYHLLKDNAGAVEHLAYAIKLDPSLARAQYHLAVVYEEQGRLSDALEHYRLADQNDAGGLFGELARRALERLGGG